jgi:hypothetical protein
MQESSQVGLSPHAASLEGQAVSEGPAFSECCFGDAEGSLVATMIPLLSQSLFCLMGTATNHDHLNQLMHLKIH